MRSGLGSVGAFLLMGLATINGSAAQSAKVPARDDVFNFAGTQQSEYTADLREKFIGSLVTYCQAVFESLPTNTPAEDAWVVSEENTRDAAKIQRLWKSKEYSRSYLKAIFSQCKDTTAMLIELIQYFSKKPNSSEQLSRLEANGLIKLALNFDVFLDDYSSNIEITKDVRSSFDEFRLHVIRICLLRAARSSLDDVH
ncbi:hypothetical protein [Bradyrhizobium sp. S69]|uniref:hypothetical protein n=1 Tax=Bradyrhizobium sp. S69 TaxID=1641856 RepID=UPI00131D9871|nr:hypothetical protein [Bradyrhizobium sp. S69]